jgi:signal peptidase I
MDQTARIVDRAPSRALIASIALPGMGQIYNGELFKGTCYFILFVLIPLVLVRLTMVLPDKLLLYGILTSFAGAVAVYATSVADAWTTASRRGAGYALKRYNRGYFYALLCLGGSITISFSLVSLVQNDIVQFCSIATGSMEPAVFPGDFVIIDKTGKEAVPVQRNDIILFRYPDDRSKLYIKRIAGLPGDSVPIDNGSKAFVPHGTVFVLGDNRAHAVDSRSFGPVPQNDILGRARLIYFSLEPRTGKVRFGRINKVLP